MNETVAWLICIITFTIGVTIITYLFCCCKAKVNPISVTPDASSNVINSSASSNIINSHNQVNNVILQSHDENLPVVIDNNIIVDIIPPSYSTLIRKNEIQPLDLPVTNNHLNCENGDNVTSGYRDTSFYGNQEVSIYSSSNTTCGTLSDDTTYSGVISTTDTSLTTTTTTAAAVVEIQTTPILIDETSHVINQSSHNDEESANNMRPPSYEELLSSL